MIAIIDYGSGNVAAIANIYQQLKIPHAVTMDADVLARAERYILPGVGAFDTTMHYLENSGLIGLVREQVFTKSKKVLGICVGMQILADGSDEGVHAGLGWIPGRVRKIDESLLTAGPRLPHMGWNSVTPRSDAPLLSGVDVERGFYFLHNYYFDAMDPSDVVATVHYGKDMACAVARANVFGMQFHPEKSHSNGVAVFRNFARA
jgi:imidazole glycerol-phosphate synthase subunit HisH